MPVRETPDAVSLLVDLGRRRRHAVGTHAADRYVFLDADAEILDERYCARLYVAHVLSRRDLILSMVRYYDRVLPEFPIGLGRIDMANYTFSAAIAREHPYPNDHDPSFGLANAYRFWTAISASRTPLVLDAICVRKDGHKGYARLTDRFIGEAMAGQGPGASLIPLFGNSFDESDVDGVARVLESHLARKKGSSRASFHKQKYRSRPIMGLKRNPPVERGARATRAPASAGARESARR
jgi:hypothetical protein